MNDVRTRYGVTLLVLGGIAVMAIWAKLSSQKAPHPAAQLMTPQQEACTTAVTKAYLAAGYSISTKQLQNVHTLMSVEARIAKRRLQEEYCFRFAECLYPNRKTLEYQSAFGSCLDDEERNQFDADHDADSN